ncbi:deacetylase Oant_2987-like [Babylonia areolata]|uniref:deacetylase Oant_2987-like n=1 Tax=Babylonia areolata TaxID=304850 RepID=UPI003FD1A307
MEDLFIRGGRILDPANNLDLTGDVLIKDGRIAVVGSGGGTGEGAGCREVDARGCVVTPGLVDCHVHAYQHATPLGINIDHCCLQRGVTAVVDAGSAGCCTLNGLRKFIRDQSKCRLYAFVHIASHGLASAGCAGLNPGGELDSLNQVDVEGCVSSILSNRDFVVGVKVRLSTSISDCGRNEQEAFRRSLQAAGDAGVPLMVHHNNSSVPTVHTAGVLSCPGSLRSGDVFTHAFHWHRGNIVNSQTGKVYPDVWEAKRRGVLFDVGHGSGSFGWGVLEACAEEGLWPDLISTDLHTQSVEGPAYDLTTVMTKMLHAGMPLHEVIAAATCKPATVIGKNEKIGSLKIGNEADITVLRVEQCDMELEDSKGETRRITQRIVPVRVFRAGTEYAIKELKPWPNPDSKKKCENNVKQYSMCT